MTGIDPSAFTDTPSQETLTTFPGLKALATAHWYALHSHGVKEEALAESPRASSM